MSPVPGGHSFVRCLRCGSDDPGTRVIDSREQADTVRRRRECASCGERFTTYERAERTGFLVVKKDGRREDYDREKLARGIRLACFKRPVPTEAIAAIVSDLEADLFGLGRAEISAQMIGERVMDALREFDDVAYVRFASVYRAFRDVDMMADEIEGLRAYKKRLTESRNQLRFRFEEEQTCWS
ncbi:MAG: transcriptional repressor NrdR [Chloroflexota bacterium]|nr:MAG: transcriptional repressor NrdR [Chloroflexota bacterium]